MDHKDTHFLPDGWWVSRIVRTLWWTSFPVILLSEHDFQDYKDEQDFT